MSENAYKKLLSSLLTSGELAATLDYDYSSDSGDMQVRKGRLLICTLKIQNEEVPEVSSRIYGSPKLELYFSSYSLEDARKYLESMSNDLKVLADDDKPSYISYSVFGKEIAGGLPTNSYTGPLKQLIRSRLLHALTRANRVNIV